MNTQIYTLEEFADLLKSETARRIINGKKVIRTIAKDGGIPKIIRDIRGAVRMQIEREGDQLSVTKYTTKLVEEHLLRAA